MNDQDFNQVLKEFKDEFLREQERDLEYLINRTFNLGIQRGRLEEAQKREKRIMDTLSDDTFTGWEEKIDGLGNTTTIKK